MCVNVCVCINVYVFEIMMFLQMAKHYFLTHLNSFSRYYLDFHLECNVYCAPSSPPYHH